jgi:hypothetical protein
MPKAKHTASNTEATTASGTNESTAPKAYTDWGLTVESSPVVDAAIMFLLNALMASEPDPSDH